MNQAKTNHFQNRHGANPQTFERLEVSHGGRLCVITPADCPFSLGRAPSCSLPLQSEVASRQHGFIVWVASQFFYVDDSRNGTYLLSGHGDEVFLHHQRLPLPRSGVLSPGLSVLDQTSGVVRFMHPRPQRAERSAFTTRPFS